MKYLIIILVLMITFTSKAQNVKPIPKKDSICYPADMNTFNDFNVLQNDFEPNSDAMKVTSFRVESTTSHTAGKLIEIKDKGIFSVKPNGDILFCPYYCWTGTLSFNYTVNDYFTGNGKNSGPCSFTSYFECLLRDVNNKCLHIEQHE